MLGYINRIIILVPFVVFGNLQDTIQTIDLENVVVKSTKINTIKNLGPKILHISKLDKSSNYIKS